MATHSSVLAWRIPGTGEPGGMPSMGLHRVGHYWCDLAAAAAADSGGQRRLKWCSLWVAKSWTQLRNWTKTMNSSECRMNLIEGSGWGTRVPVADSFWYLAKLIQFVKFKNKIKKKKKAHTKKEWILFCFFTRKKLQSGEVLTGLKRSNYITKDSNILCLCCGDKSGVISLKSLQQFYSLLLSF